MQALITLLSGIFVTPLLQLLKRRFNLSGDVMRSVAALLSFAVGIVAMLPTFYASGVTISTIFLGGSSLVAVAEATYRIVRKKFGWDTD